MNFYKCLNKQEFLKEGYKLVPIRVEDSINIMKWRNEQMYHLRQNQPLTEVDQEIYFSDVVSKIFDAEQPNQILFSFLENGICLGYGGLVHINWTDKNAEISFIMDTKLEKDSFEKIWIIYLELLEQVAFNDLKFMKIFTYAFDLRPKLYKVLEISGFKEDNSFKNIFRSDKGKVVIHSKLYVQNEAVF